MSTFPHRLRCMASNISSLALELFKEVAGSFKHIWPVHHSDHSEDIHGKYAQNQTGLFVDIYTRRSRLCAMYQRARQLTMDAVRH